MFGIFKNFDKNKNKTQISAEIPQADVREKIYVKGAKIAYYPHLIEEFKEEHAHLFSIYSSIVDSYENNQIDNIYSNLKKFKQALVDHLMKENILLYVFLKYLYIENNEKKNFAYKMQKEMTTIGGGILDFIHRATSDSFEYNREFKKELDGIGNALVARVEIEESELYSLYKQPGNI
ncbi:MAG: hemerythrin domain-containing protein [Desulfotalea sp.]